MYFDKVSIDFGRLKEGKIVEETITYKEDVKIEKISLSCGCLDSSHNKKERTIKISLMAGKVVPEYAQEAEYIRTARIYYTVKNGDGIEKEQLITFRYISEK